MLSAGRTSGVFQLEITRHDRRSASQPQAQESIEDITAIISLYRPGPMDMHTPFPATAQHTRRR